MGGKWYRLKCVEGGHAWTVGRQPNLLRQPQSRQQPAEQHEMLSKTGNAASLPAVSCSVPQALTHRRMRSRAWHEYQAPKLQQMLPPSVKSWRGGGRRGREHIEACMQSGGKLGSCFSILKMHVYQPAACVQQQVQRAKIDQARQCCKGQDALQLPAPPPLIGLPARSRSQTGSQAGSTSSLQGIKMHRFRIAAAIARPEIMCSCSGGRI